MQRLEDTSTTVTVGPKIYAQSFVYNNNMYFICDNRCYLQIIVDRIGAYWILIVFINIAFDK